MTATESVREEIYRTYHPKVLSYLRYRLQDSYAAEDLAADVFVKVYARLDSYDERKASLSTWIYTITRNALTDRYRTRRPTEELPETLAAEDSPEESVCNADLLERLADALEKLPERERDIVILRYSSGMTLRAIAARLGISYAYVKILQNKALGFLKKELE